MQAFDVIGQRLLIDICLATYWAFEFLDLGVSSHMTSQLGGTGAALAAVRTVVLVDAVVKLLV